jgi:hypothetical protein
MAEVDKIKMAAAGVSWQRVLVCGVAIYDWAFAFGVLEGCARSCDLAVLHRGEGEWVGALKWSNMRGSGDYISTMLRTGASFTSGIILIAQFGSRLVLRASASAFFAPRNVL